MTRGPTPRHTVARPAANVIVLVVLAVTASWRCATGQGGGWVASPSHPTVGDTVWLVRQITAPPGWRVRAGKLDDGEEVEPLGAPSVLRAVGGWLVRYPVVAWSPGPHQIALPPVWRLAPDGRTDSLPGGVAWLDVRGVIPDSVSHPAPQGAIAPIRAGRSNPLFPFGATLAALGLGAAGLAWRRRPPRAAPADLQAPLEREVPDARWLAAGEPKAVAARATARLRAAIARAEPMALMALSTAECLAVLEHRIARASLGPVAEVLQQLDRVAFASAHGSDVAALAERARALARELAP